MALSDNKSYKAQIDNYVKKLIKENTMEININKRYLQIETKMYTEIKGFSEGKYVIYYVFPLSDKSSEIHTCSYVDFPRLFEIISPDVAVLHKRDDVMSHNVGDSNYAKKRIQPWDIWEEYDLNPWDADIVKRIVRDKESQSRRLDYEKIIHICQKRISQIDNGIKIYGKDIINPTICDQCCTAFSDKYKFCPECGDENKELSKKKKQFEEMIEYIKELNNDD